MISRYVLAIWVIVFIYFAFPFAVIPLLDIAFDFVTGTKHMRPDSVIGTVGLMAYYFSIAAIFCVTLILAVVTVLMNLGSSTRFIELAGVQIFALLCSLPLSGVYVWVVQHVA